MPVLKAVYVDFIPHFDRLKVFYPSEKNWQAFFTVAIDTENS